MKKSTYFILIRIYNLVKSWIKKNLNQKSLFLLSAIPITFNGISGEIPKFLKNYIVPALPQKEIIEKNTERLSEVVFDQKNPFGIVLKEKNVVIQKAESNFDIKQKELLSSVNRDVVAREEAPKYKPSPKNASSVSRVDEEQKRLLVRAAAEKYNIPWQILEAVWQVETGKSWDTTKRSSHGAVGPMQFMPATWEKYKVDADGNGYAEIHSACDSLHGAAKYLAANGASTGRVEFALFRYNHSKAYVIKVLSIARSLGYNPV